MASSSSLAALQLDALDNSDRAPRWCWRAVSAARTALGFASYGDLDEEMSSVATRADLSVTASKVAAAGRAAFKDMEASLRAAERASSLPVTENKPAVLCYLCSIQSAGRKPMTDAQHAAFCAYVAKRYRTYSWLAPKLALPAFFLGPVALPLAVFLLLTFCEGLAATVGDVVGVILTIVAAVIGQLAGWVITGTQPNASSEAANLAQNMLIDLTNDYQSYGLFLLDLYCSETTALREFAVQVADHADVGILEDVMLALVPRPDPNEPEDPLLSRARFRHLLGPLREVAAYIRSEGCVAPIDETIRAHIELAQLREQTAFLAQKLELLEAAGEQLTQKLDRLVGVAKESRSNVAAPPGETPLRV